MPSLIKLDNELTRSFTPIVKNVIEAINFRIFSGKKTDIVPPLKAPSKLAKTSADEEPRKTANGLLEVPLIVKVASCVLSPNSATKTVRNVDSNKLKIIYNYLKCHNLNIY